MTQRGYLLESVELYNWGNFQKWQKFSLNRHQAASAEHFTKSSNSLIAGINGSGKSTLIDGIMAVLLPFASSLNLGVTHDSESGTGGGRTIRDYVLGKFSATGGEASAEGERIYSRRSGSSAILLRFRHSTGNNKVVTIGRIFWFADYRLKEDSLCLIAHGPLSIGDRSAINLLDEKGHTFRSGTDMRRHFALKHPWIQLYDKVGTYFRSISSIFGAMTRDDLKLLNRAFYLKSVGRDRCLHSQLHAA